MFLIWKSKLVLKYFLKEEIYHLTQNEINEVLEAERKKSLIINGFLKSFREQICYSDTAVVFSSDILINVSTSWAWVLRQFKVIPISFVDG